jgi:glycosyltransferase involved in cell wall biosynthesis
MVAALDALGEPHSVLFEKGVPQRQAHPDVAGRSRVESSEDDELDLNLVCINADPMPAVLDRLWPRFTDGRWTIGSWMWEVEAFPPWMASAADLVDEVWTASAHSAAAIGSAIDKPVHTFPLPVIPHRASALGRSDFGLPGGFMFLFCFDFYSVAERKNPFGVIDAFRRAFAPGEGPHLVLKTINGSDKLPELERLRLHAEGRPDIRIHDGYLDAPDQRALVACCDAYVSLHRAEGFGYTLAEAMLAGKPVIATGYSGNLEFMNDRNALLVGYTMTSIPEGCDPYPAGGRWAAPDVEEAAEYMRLVVDDPARAGALAQQGRRDISERHSPAARVPLLAARLAASRAAAADPARRRAARARPRFVESLATPRVRRLVRRYLG